MKIVVVGGGKVGEVICQELSTEENDIVLIDKNQDLIDRLLNKFDIMGICGNGASYDILVEQNLGLEALIGVIKHELCHYHLHQTGGGYRHRDQDFKRLLHQVGGSRFVERMKDPNFIYECTACHHRYPRMHKMNTTRYVCGKCRGKLILLD